jgi:anti-sigma B factor antagonist
VELSISRIENGYGWTVVSAAGEIDIATAPALDEALDAAVAEGNTRVAVDLEQVTFMDSTGLRSLITSDRRLTELEGDLVIIAPGGPARRLLEIAGVAGTLQIVDSVGDLPET